jgi:hypothetical protein
LTAEQLQQVRAERWRHIANPLLTADDARTWLDAAGLCLFLPRRQQFLAPAPSFVEACAGAPSETPSREAIDNAASLMRRLVAEGGIIPLNLFGTPSETPDFLASLEAFPFLFSLRGTRDWKTVPGGKTSPLVVEIWKLLEKESSLTAIEIQSALGRELTEAAVLRGLMELWSNLRVLPEFEGGAPTRWSLTQTRFKDALTAAGKLSQTAALSALVSLYLESVVAATSEEVETFLSPLTSRSRVRETVNGLAATRQLSMLPVGTQSMFHIAGGLPEFAEPAAEPVREAGSELERKPRQAERAPRVFDRGKKPFERKPFERKTFERKTGERKAFGRKPPERAAGGEGAPRKSDGERKSSPRKSWPRKAEGERKPFGKRPAFGKKPFDKAARPFRRDARPFEGERPAGGERAAGAERSSFRPAGRSGPPSRSGPSRSSSGGKFPPKRFGSKSSGEKFAGRGDRPWTPRPAAGDRERGPSAASDRERPFRPREDGGEKRTGGFGGKAKFAGSKPSGSKFSGAKFSGGKKFEGAGRPKTGGPKFGGPRSGGAKFGGARFGGKGKAPDGEKRPFFRKRPEEGSGGEGRPRTFGRPAFGGSKPGGGPRFKKPAGEGSERPRAARPAFGKSAGFSKPGFAKSGFGKGKPSEGSYPAKKFTGAKKFGGEKKFGAGKKFGGVKKFGSRKPGGTKPPFRKRKDEGKKNAE